MTSVKDCDSNISNILNNQYGKHLICLSGKRCVCNGLCKLDWEYHNRERNNPLAPD
ncbi:14391_t:CDS:1, partial [Funneliformis geosporum]